MRQLSQTKSQPWRKARRWGKAPLCQARNKRYFSMFSGVAKVFSSSGLATQVLLSISSTMLTVVGSSSKYALTLFFRICGLQGYGKLSGLRKR